MKLKKGGTYKGEKSEKDIQTLYQYGRHFVKVRKEVVPLDDVKSYDKNT